MNQSFKNRLKKYSLLNFIYRWLREYYEALISPLQKRLLTLFYYRYDRLILKSRPVACHQESELEIHLVTCKRDANNALWCLKTFFYYSGIKTRLFIHDDGTLNEDLRRMFQRHFVNCDIINKEDADEEMKKQLKGYELCSKYRIDHCSPFAMKLLDCIFYSKTKKVLLLDSDMLFFKEPTEVLNNVRWNNCFFMIDYQNAYSFSVDFLGALFKENIIEQLNTGLLYLSSAKMYNLDIIESFLRVWFDHNCPMPGLEEQTAYAVLFSKYPKEVTRLSAHYQISDQPISGETISHHFVDDGYRNRFYKYGVTYLLKSGFIKKINAVP
jgi:hypothetical protein